MVVLAVITVMAAEAACGSTSGRIGGKGSKGDVDGVGGVVEATGLGRDRVASKGGGSKDNPSSWGTAGGFCLMTTVDLLSLLPC
jgi:hypothetical protein